MDRKEIIFFDVDDTLYDHTYAAEKALASLIKTFPFFSDLSLSELKEKYGTLLEESHILLLKGDLTFQESLEYRWSRILSYFSKNEGSDWRILSDAYRIAYLESERSVPGAYELITELRNIFRIGVITNNRVEEQVGKLTRCNLIDNIEILVISEQVGALKPDREIYHYALKMAAVEATEALMIGDSIKNDVLAALNVNMKAIWFNRSGEKPSEHIDLPSLSTFEPAEEVISAIKDILHS